MKPRHDRAAPGPCLPIRVIESTRAGHLSVMLEEAMAWLDPKPGGRYCDATSGGRAHLRHARAVGAGRSGDRAGPRSGGAGDGRRRLAIVRRARHAGPRALLGGARRARTARDDSGRRLPGRPRRVVAAARPPRARVLVPGGRSAGHADGPDDRRNRGRAAAPGGRGRADADHPRARARSGTRRASRARSSRRARAGPVETTGKLAAIVARAHAAPRDGKNPATRTFQALRITVNDELGELERFLDGRGRLPAPGRPAGA